jgi:DNA-binding MarR family transcriptional regulator
MSNSRRDELEDEVNRAMRIQVMRAVLLTQAIAAQSGANPADVQALNLLTLQGPMTPSRLAEAMAMTKGGAITAMVDRLEKAGYVRRTRDPADRRQVLVEPVLGAPLRRLMARFDPVGRALAGVLEQYTDEQLELIFEFTERTNDAIRRLWPDGALQPRRLPA